MAYDILIKSGTVFDGSGVPGVRADVGIKDDKISDIGDLGGETAGLTINAEGLFVAPGFIDLTNHSDTHLTLFKYPLQESMLAQGITTIMGGVCGTSLAPLASPSVIKAIQKWADPGEVNVDWLSFGEFLKTLERGGLGVNFGSLVGYGTLRRGVMSDVNRPATIEERAKMKHMLHPALDEGAFGLSSGLLYSHEKAASIEELVDVVGELKGEGVFSAHLRSEGRGLITSVNEVMQIARESEAPLHISHFKALGRKSWPEFLQALHMLERAHASGLDVTFDVFPYLRTGSLLYLLLPGWSYSGGFALLFKRLKNKQERNKIIEELKTATLHYDKIIIASAKNKIIVGRSIKELADSAGLSTEEAMLEILLANEGRVTFFGRTIARKNMERALTHPLSVISSDGVGYDALERHSGDLVHPRSFGAFAHFLHHIVNGLKTLKWEEAIEKITALPAKKFNIALRGLLKKNYFADAAIFNPALLKDRATYKNPFIFSRGLEWVLVNGQVVLERGALTGKKNGRVLRRGH